MVMTMRRSEGSASSRKRKVLLLGGWSSEILFELQRVLGGRHGRADFRWPSIDTPPVGCRWCCNAFVPALIVGVPAAVWAISNFLIPSGNALVSALLHAVLIAAALLVARLLLAALVRVAITRSIKAVMREGMPMSLLDSHGAEASWQR